MLSESLESLLVQGTREALEGVVEDVVSALGEDSHGILNRSERAALSELDDVLVGNEVRVVTTGDEDGSRSGSLGGGWGTQDHGKDGEEDRQTHFEKLMLVYRK